MKRFFLLLVSFFLFIFFVLFIFLKINLEPLSQDSKNRIFTIDKGDKTLTIAHELETNDFIKNKFAFVIYSVLSGKNKNLQAGTYRLSSSLSVPEMVKKISSGGVSDYWLKIIEGSRIEEIIYLFPDNISFTDKDFLNKTKNQEGYIFPDSYLIPQYFSLDQILNTISQNFDQKFSQAKKNKNSNLDDYDSLILASLLEREANSLVSKQMIAGILLNRLNIGMALQVDATVQYARDSKISNLKDYWKPVTKSDLQIVSSFNTYKNPGLPPGPICNPGYDSLYAAFHPTNSDYLYYITGNDGQMHYATTLEEHNINISKYLK